jgi:hypothetical protein
MGDDTSLTEVRGPLASTLRVDEDPSFEVEGKSVEEMMETLRRECGSLVQSSIVRAYRIGTIVRGVVSGGEGRQARPVPSLADEVGVSHTWLYSCLKLVTALSWRDICRVANSVGSVKAVMVLSKVEDPATRSEWVGLLESGDKKITDLQRELRESGQTEDHAAESAVVADAAISGPRPANPGTRLASVLGKLERSLTVVARLMEQAAKAAGECATHVEPETQEKAAGHICTFRGGDGWTSFKDVEIMLEEAMNELEQSAPVQVAAAEAAG